MCKIVLTIDTGGERPHTVTSIHPKTWDNRLDACLISNAIYVTKLLPSGVRMQSSVFLEKIESLLGALKTNESEVTKIFETKPTLHFIALIDFLEKAKANIKRHPKTDVEYC